MYPQPKFFLLLSLLSLSLKSIECDEPVPTIDYNTALLLKVDHAGQGDFINVQDAINAVPCNNSNLVFILISPGQYREKVMVNRPLVILSGSGAGESVITWNDSADSSGGTFNSATLTIEAPDFVARRLTIRNTYGAGSQAVAVKVSEDRAAFYGCKFFAYQDTLLDDKGRHYYNNCYIQGATDFICGNGLSLFENCHLHSVSMTKGAVTAQKRASEDDNTGFSFVNCVVSGIGKAILGRAWGAFSRVVYANTYMSDAILPYGWDDWDHSSSTVYYGEYQCYGPGSNLSGRVPWSYNLSTVEAAPFLTQTMIDGQDWIRAPPTNFTRPIQPYGQIEKKSCHDIFN
ncbi:hypothetical protein AMTRI_Chr04g182250 [Amborella trichopoda]|uniref:putative pectinesterase 11 n=1 Tax=Amborella trichopoda TaxID=13333 RepID=UPI0009BE5A79|nr:putative pectinesterase 11 [Amborella trichopoda]|eukprot:XP_020528346.1 putative pectinesterase 11 [Amborella trichopoda]